MAADQIVQRMSPPGADLHAGRVATLVAVHGNGGGAHRFARVAPLMPPDVALVAVTLPGFAAVPADPALRSLADFAEHLAMLVAPLPRPRIVLGHGIGGSIALELVQRHADLVDGLILHAPVGTRLDRRIFPRLMAIPGARALGRRLFASRLLRPCFRRLLFSRAVPPAYLDRFFEEYRQCSVFSQMFDLITPSWFRGLRPTELPAVLLWGEDERLLAVDQVDDYRALLPRSAVRRVPGWGHFPMIERPAAYAAEIASLARSLVTQATTQETLTPALITPSSEFAGLRRCAPMGPPTPTAQREREPVAGAMNCAPTGSDAVGAQCIAPPGGEVVPRSRVGDLGTAP